MNKNKRIIISLLISLTLLIIFNIVYSKYVKADEVQAYILVEDVITGEKITLEKVKKVTFSNKLDGLKLISEIGNTVYATTALKKRSIINYAEYSE